MFLWARLVCDLLDSGYFDDEQQILQTVEEIPRELSELYVWTIQLRFHC
jgi:hypothetical protein